MDNNDNRGFYMGPMVYYGTYPIPLPLWEQMYGSRVVNEESLRSDEYQSYFSLPFPEDQE